MRRFYTSFSCAQAGLEPALASEAALQGKAQLAAYPKTLITCHEGLKHTSCVQAGLEPALASEAALQSEARPAADPEPEQAGPAADSHHLLAPDARANGGTGPAAAAERPPAGPAWGDGSVGQPGSGAPSGAPAQRDVGILAESLI